MVSQNVAQAEFDTKRGEILLFSRHVFEKKGQKIVGAVSILLVQNDAGEELSDCERKLSIPCSLSVISVPCIEQNGFPHSQSGINNHHLGFEHQNFSHERFTKRSNELLHGKTENEQESNNQEIHPHGGPFLPESLDSSLDVSRNNVGVVDLTKNQQTTENRDGMSKSTALHSTSHQTSSYKHDRHPNSLSLHDNNLLKRHLPGREFNQQNQRLNAVLSKARLIRQKSKGIPIQHTLKPRIRIDNNSNNPENRCSVCDEEIVTCDGVLHHSQIHNMPQKCVICGYVLSSKNNLKRHAAGHVSNVLYTCYVCSAMFRRKDNMRQHMKAHESGKSYLITRKPYRRFPMKNIMLKRKVSKIDAADHELRMENKQLNDSTVNSGLFNKTQDSSRNLLNLIDKQNSVGDKVSEKRNSDKTGLEPAALNTLTNCETFDNNFDKRIADLETSTGKSKEDIPEGHTFTENDELSVRSEEGRCDINLTKHVKESPPTKEEKKEKEESHVVYYSCNTCGVQFHKLESLKRHAVSVHSEQNVGNNIKENNQIQNCVIDGLSQSLKTEPIQISDGTDPPFTEDLTISNACNNMAVNIGTTRTTAEAGAYIGNHNSAYGETLINSFFTRRTVFAANSSAFSGDGVIDIEKLGELSSVFDKSENFVSNEVSSANLIKTEPEQGIQQWSSFNSMNPLSNSSLPYFGNNFGIEKPLMASKKSDNLAAIATTSQNKKLRLNKQKPVCSACGVVFQTWMEIIHHGEIHKDQLLDKFTCIACGTVLCSKDNLRRHAVNHMGICHPCPHCSVKFTRSDNLKKHMKVAHSANT